MASPALDTLAQVRTSRVLLTAPDGPVAIQPHSGLDRDLCRDPGLAIDAVRRERAREERAEAHERAIRIAVAKAARREGTAQEPSSSPLDRRELLQKRARAKYLSRPLDAALAALRTPLERSYWNSWHCSDPIQQLPDGRLVTALCKTRWCIVCGRIRTALAIRKYASLLECLDDLQFVTLSRPNVLGHALREEIRDLLAVEHRIRGTLRRKHGMLVTGIRKLECTFSVERNDFHPHLHIVIADDDVACALVERWLQYNPTAGYLGQDLRPAGAPIELFKYFTKLVTSRPGGGRTFVPAHALDTIFQAMVGLRVWQPLGLLYAATRTSPDEEADLDANAGLAPDPQEESVTWEWSQQLADWVDYTTGAVLSGYKPSNRVTVLVCALGMIGEMTPPEERKQEHQPETDDENNDEYPVFFDAWYTCAA